jgi:hypothetical protein
VMVVIRCYRKKGTKPPTQDGARLANKGRVHHGRHEPDHAAEGRAHSPGKATKRNNGKIRKWRCIHYVYASCKEITPMTPRRQRRRINPFLSANGPKGRIAMTGGLEGKSPPLHKPTEGWWGVGFLPSPEPGKNPPPARLWNQVTPQPIFPMRLMEGTNVPVWE